MLAGPRSPSRRPSIVGVTATIDRVRAATVRHPLDVPIDFGAIRITHREFCLVRVDDGDGGSGVAFGMTRDGPVASIVRRTVAPAAVGRALDDPAAVTRAVRWANPATHSAGVGMRALSLLDLATWDLAAKRAGLSVTRLLGGTPQALPVAGVVGYPPSISPEATVEQVATMWAQGFRRFKLPIAPTPDASIARLRAVREAFPDAWLGIDNNFAAHSLEAAIAFGRRLDELGGIGWFEDIVPPGDAAQVAAIRAAIRTPVAMGDDQGGAYHPEALLAAQAIDVLRVDATTNGGVSGLREAASKARAAGVGVAPHIYPHVHARILAGLGITDAQIEWAIPGTGVHPMDDGLRGPGEPVVIDGWMQPLADLPGFGPLVDAAWIGAQDVDDPDRLLDDLPTSAVVAR